MAKSTQNADGLTPTNVTLLAEPLEFIAQDHLRIRTMCAEIDKLQEADRVSDSQKSEIHAFLTTELTNLLSDENDQLVPLVLARAQPEDELLRLQQRLQSEHQHAGELLSKIVQSFDPDASQKTPDDAMKERVFEFTAYLRRHLILKNAVLMPLARLRLTKDDLTKLGDTMSLNRQSKKHSR